MRNIDVWPGRSAGRAGTPLTHFIHLSRLVFVSLLSCLRLVFALSLSCHVFLQFSNLITSPIQSSSSSITPIIRLVFVFAHLKFAAFASLLIAQSLKR